MKNDDPQGVFGSSVTASVSAVLISFLGGVESCRWPGGGAEVQGGVSNSAQVKPLVGERERNFMVTGDDEGACHLKLEAKNEQGYSQLEFATGRTCCYQRGEREV